MPTRCVFVKPTGNVRVYFRRFASKSDPKYGECKVNPYGFHDSQALLGDVPANYEVHEDRTKYLTAPPMYPHNDSRWPEACICGRQFLDDDHWQMSQKQLYLDESTGEINTIEKAPVGWMWDAYWWPTKGEDGIALAVRLPGNHDWIIESAANNCVEKNNKNHRCWTRTGILPNVTVNPSIQVPGYHGYLRDGFLTDNM